MTFLIGCVEDGQVQGTTIGPLRAMAVEELKAKLSPESQQAIDQSQRQTDSLKRPHDHLEEPGDEQDDEVRDDIDEINWDLEFIDDVGAL
jgi:FtsZ-binding cell division protein ZapB